VTPLPQGRAEHEEVFPSYLPGFQLELRKEKLKAKEAKAAQAKNASKASIACTTRVVQLLAVEPEDAGTIPSWSSSLHFTHDLRCGGGGIWCLQCGGALAQFRHGSQLLIPCLKTLAEGSIWRRDALKLGKCVGWSQWPDGRNKKIRIKPILVQGEAGREGDELIRSL
jgi:hypothetical protein